jgi:hypothetical protein
LFGGGDGVGGGGCGDRSPGKWNHVEHDYKNTLHNFILIGF